MIYKDSTFEISENQVKFKNRIMLFFLSIFIASIFNLCLSSIFSMYKVNVLNAVFMLIGLVFAFLIFKSFTGLYLKNTINLSNIEYVRIHTWDNSIDKDRTFWGTGRYKYHFPTGINKKKNPQVILLHIKDRRAAVGFVPENIENVISVLDEKGIKILTETHGDEQS